MMTDEDGDYHDNDDDDDDDDDDDVKLMMVMVEAQQIAKKVPMQRMNERRMMVEVEVLKMRVMILMTVTN